MSVNKNVRITPEYKAENKWPPGPLWNISRQERSPSYEGLEITGKVETALSRGKTIIEDGAYHGSAGDGRYLRRGTNQYLI